MKLLTLLIFTFYLSSTLYAQTAQEIIEKAEDLIKGSSAQGTIEMNIVTPGSLFLTSFSIRLKYIHSQKVIITRWLSKKNHGSNRTF